ncbi:MAG: hypothetical protein LBT81_04390 [Helicobacteraceae bacterium]|jgi:hypothetical protein|nr:hypothetical protein [Helicobacteraceae bacterium]
MSVTPIAGVIYSNQNAPAASSIQQQAQSRADFQSMLTSSAAEGQKTEVQETRPAEASERLNPDREHQKQEDDEREKEREEQKQEIKEQSHEKRLLDIKV